MYTAFFIIIFLWLIVTTFFLFRTIHHYNTLTKGISKLALKDILESLLEEKREVNKLLKEFDQSLKKLHAMGLTHIQRIGIVRFNPFSDTGGSQSFSLALLDGEDNGIIVTSLYGRTGNRWYIKSIKAGKGTDLELSKEEQTAIKKAQKEKI